MNAVSRLLDRSDEAYDEILFPFQIFPGYLRRQIPLKVTRLIHVLGGAGPDLGGAGPDLGGAGPDPGGAGPDLGGAGPDLGGAGPELVDDAVLMGVSLVVGSEQFGCNLLDSILESG